MPEYLAPGVLVEEVSFRSKSIEGVGTSVAGLVGPTRTGPLRGRPELLTSFADFVRIYGDAGDLSLGGTKVLNHTAIAAKAFFDGGGTKLFVSRVVSGVNASNTASQGSSASFGTASDASNNVTFTSRFPGGVGNYTLELRWRDSENLLKLETTSVPEEDEVVFLEATGLTSAVRTTGISARVPAGRFPMDIRALVRRSGDNFVIVDNRCEIEAADAATVTGTHLRPDGATDGEEGILVAAGLVNSADTSVTFTRVSVKQPSSGDPCMTQDCSYNELHALQVLDDSMEPEFPEKCVIVIEPSEVCASGAYVIINVDGERWFRQYQKDEQGNERLVAVNSSYPDIPLVGTRFKIEGVIVQRNIKRKIKHYQPYQPNNDFPLATS